MTSKLLRVARTPHAVVFLAGLASALAFAPFNLWPVALLACVILIGRVAGTERPRRAFALGWYFGLGQFLFGFEWIADAFTHQARMPAWYGGMAVILLSLYLAIYPAIACWLAWWLGRRTRVGLVLCLSATWMLGELIRGIALTGFPWNPLGAIWLPLPAVAQGASWIGAYGLSGFAVLVAGGIWLALRREWPSAIAVVLPTALVLLLAPLAVSPTDTQAGPGVQVRVVQPNITQDERDNSADDRRNMQIYTALSGKPDASPRLLLWPEGAITTYLQLDGAARAALAQLLGARDILLIGGDSASLDSTGKNLLYHNSVFALGHEGTFLWRYDKAHLVPFGEYLPLRPVLSRIGLSTLVAGAGDFSAGPGPRTFDLPGFGTVGVQLCFEIVFSAHVVDEAHRPAFIFNPSNDAWYGRLGPPQHLAQARLRAIEEGLPIVRATINGISAVIDGHGRVVASVPHEHAGVLDATLPQALKPTVFARFGLAATGAFGLLLAAAGVAAARAPRMRNGKGP